MATLVAKVILVLEAKDTFLPKVNEKNQAIKKSKQPFLILID